MNEFCAVGLHSFGDWQDEPGSKVRQTRTCSRCRKQERRNWLPEDKAPPPYDPYRDLTG